MSIFKKWYGLDGNTALVVGASKGLGREISLALSTAGARVACGARTMDRLQDLASEIGSQGGFALPISVDVGKEEDIIDMVRAVQDGFGKIDILFYSAGLLEAKPALETSLEDWNRILCTNVTGAFLTAREVGKVMKEQGGGRMVFISSAFGDRILPYVLPYTVSKGGLNQMVRNLAYEWAKYDIRVNGIAPGYFHTDMPAAALENQKTRDAILKRIPLRRVGKPEEIGPLAVYLASSNSAYVTGEIIRIDGGQSYNVS